MTQWTKMPNSFLYSKLFQICDLYVIYLREQDRDGIPMEELF